MISIVLAVSVGAVYAFPVRGDSSETRTRTDDEAMRMYLAAERVAFTEIRRNMPSLTVSINQLVHNTDRHCLAIAADAPRNPSRWPVEVGITETLLVAAAHADAHITAKLGQKVSGLRWTMPRLTDLVQREVLATSALAHHKLPELCSDLREWARSRFQHVPPTLRQFSHEVKPFSEGSSLLSALSKYESTTERREVEQLGRTVTKELTARILIARKRMFNVVGLRHGTSAVVVPTPSGTVFDRLRRKS